MAVFLVGLPLRLLSTELGAVAASFVVVAVVEEVAVVL